MKFLIIALCVCAASAVPAGRQVQQAAAAATAEVRAAGPAGADAAAAVVHQESDSFPDGSFASKFETDNNIVMENAGELKTVDKVSFVAMRGQYSYVNPEGKTVVVTWVADENGFQPQGEDIPVAPEVPAAIARSLEYIKEHPYKEEEAPKRA